MAMILEATSKNVNGNSKIKEGIFSVMKIDFVLVET